MDNDLLNYIKLHFDNRNNANYGSLTAMFTRATGLAVPDDKRKWSKELLLKWDEWWASMDQRALAWLGGMTTSLVKSDVPPPPSDPPPNERVTCRNCGTDFVTSVDEPGRCPKCDGARALHSVSPGQAVQPGEGEPLFITFDGPPGPEGPRFIDVHTTDGRSVRAGEWIERHDGYWGLGPFYIGGES